MSKLQFRARALDSQKPMAVYLSDELADLSEMTSMNRAVPQMPTGMEKEEESEHHLQRAMSAQQVFGDASSLVIPTPEAKLEPTINYGDVYVNNVKVPKQLIHMQALGLDEDIPDYDMDSEDEEWVAGQSKSQPLTNAQFEGMMDTLEKGSGNQALSLREAQALLRADDDVVIAVYDYWLAKRLRLRRPLIPAVKTERRDGSTASDPYVAFRRRTERMQTRKNRKNGESSYEKMLKLKRDIVRALSLLEMVKMREKAKRDLMSTTLSVVEKRFELQDWTGQLYSQYVEQHRIRAPPPAPPLPITQPATTPTTPIIHSRRISEGRLSRNGDRDDLWTEDRERHFRPSFHRSLSSRRRSKTHKRRHNGNMQPGAGEASRVGGSSDAEEMLLQSELVGDMEEDIDVEGPFPFQRHRNVQYRGFRGRPGVWPHEDPVPHCSNVCHPHYRFSYLSINNRFVGFARRRVGRGGRVWIDRNSLQRDATCSELEDTLAEQTFHLERRETTLSARSNELWPHYLSRSRLCRERLNLFHEAREAVDRAHNSEDAAEQPLVDITYLKQHAFNMYPSASEDSDIRHERDWQQTSHLFDSQPTSQFGLTSCNSATEHLVSRLVEQENMKEVGYHDQSVVTDTLDLNDSVKERNALFRSLDEPKDQPPVDLFEDCQEKEEDAVVVCSNGPVLGTVLGRGRGEMSLGLYLQDGLPNDVRERESVGTRRANVLKGSSAVESVDNLMLLGEDGLDVGSRRQISLLSETASPLEPQPLMS